MNFLFTSSPNQRRSLMILAVVVVLGAGLTSISHTSWASPAVFKESHSQQGVDKSLDIERYDNEPLQLVELKVGDQAVTDKIISKWRSNNDGLDTVTFKATDGWFRHLNVKLRNVSGRSILGVRAHLFFQPPNEKNLYSLPLATPTLMKQGIVEPNGDITLVVTDQAWTLTTGILKRYNVDPDQASVSLAVDLVSFSADLQWSKGQMLRPDPTIANKWIPVEKVVPQ